MKKAFESELGIKKNSAGLRPDMLRKQPKEKLSCREVKMKLGRNQLTTPIHLFDANPYVQFQRQVYFSEKLNYPIPDNLSEIKKVGAAGKERLEHERRRNSQSSN
jgi:hypothetical protein